MILTRLTTIDIRPLPWAIAHLYEHIFIEEFYEYLTANEHNADLFGWINAHTFEDVMFINSGHYSKKTALAYDAFVQKKLVFTPENVHHAIHCIQAEERETWAFDSKLLIASLEEASAFLSSKKPLSTPFYLPKITKAAQLYEDTTLHVEFPHAELDEFTLLLRLSVTISDICTRILQKEHAYIQGVSELLNDGATTAEILLQYTHEQKSEFATIGARIEATLHSYLDDDTLETILENFSLFQKEQLWQELPIRFYENSGIVTTNNEIAALATKERIARIFSKAKVYSSRTTSKDCERIQT